ncbi:hypothetical protein CBW24_01605 [Pacificitalea manganoxidans]|uniref:Uncharacterized protein n=1 Tax=Pacificitalea manganoxidans TaxID=1411902 RepID=A0A291LVQ8_9RHOB|nr:hypothetical protein CBW24_01605 [Pacificitalea manganoxidans]
MSVFVASLGIMLALGAMAIVGPQPRRDRSKGSKSSIISKIWLAAQILAVVMTICSGVLQLAIYLELAPRPLQLK